MKTIIENYLKCLIGLPYGGVGRAGNMVWFSFGKSRIIKTRRGVEKKVGDYSLNVQCTWRIVRDYKIILASKDIYLPCQTYTGQFEDFNWDIPGNNRFDERIEELNNDTGNKIVVNMIEADSYGGVKILCTEGHILELFPDESTGEEFWRIFVPGSNDEHFVVTGNGIEK